MEMEDFHDDEELKKKRNEELQKLIDEVTKEAKDVVEDYNTNPSEMSGSVTVVSDKSPYLLTKEERLVDIKDYMNKEKTKSNTIVN